MRKFLSLLLAAVLICTSVILPASAEELMENEQLVAIQDEQISVQPTATGDQTTYHICFASDGRMLTGTGSSLYSNQYIQDNASMQWVFEEYLSYHGYYVTYVIRSASNNSQVLSVSSSGNLCTATWGASGYTQIWIIDGSNIATDTNVDGIGEYYLYSSGAYPFSVSTTTSASSASDIELISPSVIHAHSAMSVRSVVTSVGTSASIETPYYTPQSGSYVNGKWLQYSVVDPTICSVSDWGIVTGIAEGNTTITVTNIITRISGTCNIYVLSATELDTHILYSSGSTNEASYISAFNSAVNDFENEFFVSFVCTGSSASTEMKNIAEGCSLDESVICNENCGVLCRYNHHKGAGRLLDECSPPSGSAPYCVRFVEHALCHESYNEHYQVAGAAIRQKRSAIVQYLSVSQCKIVLRHELSHLLDANDNECSTVGSACVMNGSSTGWCNTCYDRIASYISNNLS